MSKRILAACTDPRAVVIAALLSLAGCGSSGSGGVSTPPVGGGGGSDTVDCSDAPEDCGQVLIGLTDANGDFLAYDVGVRSVTLEREDGVTVETLPVSARVDFADYVDLTELLTAATVPPGSYVNATITLDYEDAEVVVESDGEALEAVVMDPAGQPLEIATMAVELDNRDRLVVRRGVPALLTLDFDLTASHKVDLGESPVRVTAEPFLIAEVEPVESKPLRLRGAVQDVDLDAGSYDVRIRPFHLRDGFFGRVEVQTNEETTFEIDGVPYLGAEGLAALAGLEDGTITAATGELDLLERAYTAVEVLAGSSVPGAELDAVRGHVVSRSGDVLVVRGATVIRAEQSAVFNDNVEVSLGPDTRVVKSGEPGAQMGLDAISVGQLIVAFGSLTSADPGALALDAGAGWLRLNLTNLSGTVNAVDTELLTIELQEIDRRDVEAFDFSGTGIQGEDANPLAYEVATGNLSLEALDVSAPVRVSGFVRSFGAAPPDFDGRTVADFSSAHASLRIEWQGEGALAPFVSLGEDGLVLDLENPAIGERHHLRRGGVLTDLTSLPSAPVIAPDSDRPGLYGIKQGDTIQMHSDFASFVDDLAQRLDGATQATGLHAVGGYDAADNILTAHRVAVHLD